ncbi:MAG: hypothetical protein AB1733_11165 [Thermodesulfobacteriota bacterium]
MGSPEFGLLLRIGMPDAGAFASNLSKEYKKTPALQEPLGKKRLQLAVVDASRSGISTLIDALPGQVVLPAAVEALRCRNFYGSGLALNENVRRIFQRYGWGTDPCYVRGIAARWGTIRARYSLSHNSEENAAHRVADLVSPQAAKESLWGKFKGG